MSVPFQCLPPEVGVACGRLRDELGALLGDDLIALWVHGAATFDDRPHLLGDVDTHGILVRPPELGAAMAIEGIHDSIAADTGVEWDSWYILEREARGVRPPRHALWEHLVDHAWALHRAHWLAGQYVALGGSRPTDFVTPPMWSELQQALRSELDYMEGLVKLGHDDGGHGAFVVWNGCRIICSVETRNVVLSKRAAADWALNHLPKALHAAVRAAGRVYDGIARTHDESILKAAAPLVIAAARDRLRVDHE
ncbi:DUF4111 domain-containing protein [Candidatus Fermentibacteria bacterium]|nr:DUF4111 domain-containing protein [Candidatus Fermentibacteria bacterium]